MPQNRLAPPLQNSLAYSVPAPLEPGMLRPAPRVVPRRELENLSIGLGRGLTAGLEGTKQLLTQPVATARALVEAARQMGTDPGIVLEMLRAARQKAMSGSLGLGELIGENVTPGVRNRAPMMRRITGPEDFMARREKQLLAEEEKESRGLFSSANQQAHLDSLFALKANAGWLDKTNKQADVISRLQDLALPINVFAPIKDWESITKNTQKANEPLAAFTAAELISRNKDYIDQSFNNYIAAVRGYRATLNPRSSRDRQKIKDIDAILGDSRITQIPSQ